MSVLPIVAFYIDPWLVIGIFTSVVLKFLRLIAGLTCDLLPRGVAKIKLYVSFVRLVSRLTL